MRPCSNKGGTQNQHPFGIQRVMEELDHVVLHFAFKINQRDCGRKSGPDGEERRIAQKVVWREYHQIANLFSNSLTAVVLLGRTASNAQGSRPVVISTRVEAFASLFQRSAVQVKEAGTLADLGRATSCCLTSSTSSMARV